MTETRTCQATRYAKGPCTEDGPKWDVIYVNASTIITRHAVCFRHGLAESDRSAEAGSIAVAHLVKQGDTLGYAERTKR